MLLTVDIGNTAIKFGVFDGGELTVKFLIPTHADNFPAELERTVAENVKGEAHSVMISSVVPEVEGLVRDFFTSAGITTRLVTTGDNFGLKLNFPLEGFGTDRLLNASAAAERYGAPCVAVSFGTATTIDVVNSDREYLGGLIASGPRASARALSIVTSKLPEIEIAEPENVIGTNTVDAMRAGIFYSQIGLVESAVSHIKSEIGETAMVVATGGFAPLIAKKCRSVDIIEPDLTLYGLKMLYSRA